MTPVFFVLKAAVKVFNLPWGAPQTLSNPSNDVFDVAVAGNENGFFVAIWTEFDNGSFEYFIKSSTFQIGLPTWSSATTVAGGFDNVFSPLDIAVDSTGNAVGVWLPDNPSTFFSTVQTGTRIFATGNWINITSLTSGLTDEATEASVGVDKFGNAIIVWTNTETPTITTVQSSMATLGGTWSPVVDIFTVNSIANADVRLALDMNRNGRAVALWSVSGSDSQDGLYASMVTFGGSWETPIMVDSGFTFSTLDVAINSLGYAVGDWIASNSDVVVRSSFFIADQPIPPNPPAPVNASGHQIKNRFLTQIDLVNVIKWHAAPNAPQPKEYRVYRNPSLTDLVSVVPGNQEHLVIKDYNRRKHVTYTYYIVAVDGMGNFSQPTVVVVRPKCDD